jgi:hypothetical protein
MLFRARRPAYSRGDSAFPKCVESALAVGTEREKALVLASLSLACSAGFRRDFLALVLGQRHRYVIYDQELFRATLTLPPRHGNPVKQRSGPYRRRFSAMRASHGCVLSKLGLGFSQGNGWFVSTFLNFGKIDAIFQFVQHFRVLHALLNHEIVILRATIELSRSPQVRKGFDGFRCPI